MDLRLSVLFIITYELASPSVSPPLSLSQYLSLCLALRPASHRNASRGTPGETNWIKRVQSSAGARLSLALSQLPSFCLHSPSGSSASCSMFSHCPPYPFRSPSFLLVVPANPFPFRCSFSPLPPPPPPLQPPSLCFSFPLVFLPYFSGTIERQRDLLNAFACRS